MLDVNVQNMDVSMCVKCEKIECECMDEGCIMTVKDSYVPHKLNTVHIVDEDGADASGDDAEDAAPRKDEDDVPAGLRWKMFAMRLESLSKVLDKQI